MIAQFLLILAQEAEKAPKAAPGANQQSPFGMMVPLLVMGVLFYLLFMRPQMNERKKQQDAVQALKKNDRIVTIGGIIGTVADASDGDLITIKVDDGTRMKFRRSAIQGPYQEPEDKK